MNNTTMVTATYKHRIVIENVWRMLVMPIIRMFSPDAAAAASHSNDDDNNHNNVISNY